MPDHNTPCEGLKDIEKRQNETAVTIAVINAKLNAIIIGLMLFIGAMVSTLVPIMLGR